MFKMRFFRFWKRLKTTWNSLEQPVELSQKWATETKTQHSKFSYVVTIVGHYYALIMKLHKFKTGETPLVYIFQINFLVDL